jgi:hypothetical protein
VRLRPRFLRAGESTTVPQQKLRQAMPRAQEIRHDVLATAGADRGRFFLIGRNMNRREGARSIQDRQLRGVATIGLHAIAGATGDQGRRDDVARHLVRGQGPLELKAHTGRLVTTAHRALPPQALHEATIVAVSDRIECSAGVRWFGANTAATVVAAC